MAISCLQERLRTDTRHLESTAQKMRTAEIQRPTPAFRASVLLFSDKQHSHQDPHSPRQDTRRSPQPFHLARSRGPRYVPNLQEAVLALQGRRWQNSDSMCYVCDGAAPTQTVFSMRRGRRDAVHALLCVRARRACVLSEGLA